jgi:hypothetical protein
MPKTRDPLDVVSVGRYGDSSTGLEACSRIVSCNVPVALLGAAVLLARCATGRIAAVLDDPALKEAARAERPRAVR